jgi:hypothetical protein
MPLAFLNRFKRFIIDWTTQITFSKEIIPFELLDEVAEKINWTIFSSNPPKWLNEVHLIHFRNKLDWDKLIEALDAQDKLSMFDKKVIFTYANFSLDFINNQSYTDIPYAKTPVWDSSISF